MSWFSRISRKFSRNFTSWSRSRGNFISLFILDLDLEEFSFHFSLSISIWTRFAFHFSLLELPISTLAGHWYSILLVYIIHYRIYTICLLWLLQVSLYWGQKVPLIILRLDSVEFSCICQTNEIMLFCPIAKFHFGKLSFGGLAFGLCCTLWRIGWSLMNSTGNRTGKQLLVLQWLFFVMTNIYLMLSRAVNLTFAEATVAALRAALEENPEVFSSPFQCIVIVLLVLWEEPHLLLLSSHLIHLVLSCNRPPLLLSPEETPLNFSFSFPSFWYSSSWECSQTYSESF